MLKRSIRRAALAAFVACKLVVAAPPALAAVRDYEFLLLQTEFRAGDDVVIKVGLIDKRAGTPVSDAVIFARRIDMAPDGMPTMDAPLQVLPPEEPGVYRFATALLMDGGWELSLAAKVQGEEGTVTAKLLITAVP